MGTTSSRAEVEQITDQLFSVVNNTLQDCRTNITADQVDRFRNISGDLIVEGIDYTQLIGVDSKCFLTSKTQNDLKNSVEAAIKQAAEATGQAFQLTRTESETVTKLITRLAVEMQNNVSAQCPAAITLAQGVDIADVEGNVVIRGIRKSQEIGVMRECVTNTEIINNIKAELVTELDQTSKAKTEGLLSGLMQALVFALIIIGAVALVVWKGTAILKEPLFWMGLVLLLGVVLIVNYFLQWFPYRSVSGSGSAADADRAFNRTVLIVVVVVTLIDAGLMAAMLYLKSRKTATAAATTTATPESKSPAAAAATATARGPKTPATAAAAATLAAVAAASQKPKAAASP